jgi:hypothetical protein
MAGMSTTAKAVLIGVVAFILFMVFFAMAW